MKKYLLPLILVFLPAAYLFGQQSQSPYQTKVADAGEIQLEYKDFGGTGIPLIYVQDFHNYFEGPYLDSVFVTFLSKLSKKTRVLAPLRRGYGKSTDTEWGYDVATQAEDLIAFLNTMGIKKAFLLGRLPANQDITWIAEHHPDRLQGLIYWGDPVLLAGCGYPDELVLLENFSALAPDMNKEKEKRMVMSRAFYRPHFLTDPKLKINVPALRIKSPVMENMSVLRRLTEKGILDELVKTEMPGYEQELGMLKTLLTDSFRLSTLREHLIKCDPTARIDLGMKRAFGKNLKTLEKDLEQDERFYGKYLDWLQEVISSFIRNR